MMMTCGDGTFGCLGHGDWNNSVRPRLVGEYEFLHFYFSSTPVI